MIVAYYAGTGKTTAASLRNDTLDFILAPYKYGIVSDNGVIREESETLKATDPNVLKCLF